MRVLARLVGARVGHDAFEKYGIEHKTPAGLTPLMLAALAGNARLVRALLERGASRTARDAFGRTAMHYVLFPLMAKDEEDPVMIELADAYAALAFDAVDLRVEGRLVRLYPHQAEFVHLAVVTTHYASMFRWLGQIELVSRAFFVNPKVPSALGLLDCLPGSIVPAYRLAPTYVNAALAKNERDATAKPNRKLWRRIRHDEYLPNPEIAVRYGAGEVSGEFVPIEELLGKPIFAGAYVRGGAGERAVGVRGGVQGTRAIVNARDQRWKCEPPGTTNATEGEPFRHPPAIVVWSGCRPQSGLEAHGLHVHREGDDVRGRRQYLVPGESRNLAALPSR